jgi:hypothetical protein
MTDDERRMVPARYGTSHAAFLGPESDGTHPVRFFTTEGELAGCGHGTIAAQAVRLAEGGPPEARQRTGGRTFDTRSTRRPDGIEVWFDQGVIAVRPATPDDCEAVPGRARHRGGPAASVRTDGYRLAGNAAPSPSDRRPGQARGAHTGLRGAGIGDPGAGPARMLRVRAAG